MRCLRYPMGCPREAYDILLDADVHGMSHGMAHGTVSIYPRTILILSAGYLNIKKN